MKLAVGDTVIVTTGKHKGKQGKVKQVLPKNMAVVVEGINMYQKHLKPRQTGGRGQTVDRARPLNIGKIVLLCPKCHRPTRVGYLVDKTGTKQRFCHKCKAPLT